MEPAMAQFESKYRSKINIVSINIDETETPEFKKYGKLGDLSESIPFTVWIDSNKKVLDREAAGLSFAELAKRTDRVSAKLGKVKSK
jgi:hypothetical protein